MSNKFLNIILAVLLSTCVFSQAKANLIVGKIYTDTITAGLQWQYVGELDLGAGPQWNDANADGTITTGDFADALNGLEAASMLFGLSMNDIAVAAFPSGFIVNSINIGDAVVNHLAWYDSFWASNDPNRPAIGRGNEGLTANAAGDANLYDAQGDVSAFVSDRSMSNEIISYVFKTVAVPEPSTLGIFALALFGLSMRRLKKA